MSSYSCFGDGTEQDKHPELLELPSSNEKTIEVIEIKYTGEDLPNFDSAQSVRPFDKAFTEITKNKTLGGKQDSGYQYFSIDLKSKSFRFKKFLGHYFDPTPQYCIMYTSPMRDSILLQECNAGSYYNSFWIIEN